jgi:hypothetical protein
MNPYRLSPQQPQQHSHPNNTLKRRMALISRNTIVSNVSTFRITLTPELNNSMKKMKCDGISGFDFLLQHNGSSLMMALVLRLLFLLLQPFPKQ